MQSREPPVALNHNMPCSVLPRLLHQLPHSEDRVSTAPAFLEPALQLASATVPGAHVPPPSPHIQQGYASPVVIVTLLWEWNEDCITPVTWAFTIPPHISRKLTLKDL